MMRRRKLYKRKFREDERGVIGIGTLIVFIALVLVAAIASAVVINTTGQLQQRAQDVGEQTSQNLGVGIEIRTIVGEVSNVTGKPSPDHRMTPSIRNLTMTIGLYPGANSINLSRVMIEFIDSGTGNDTFAHLIHSYKVDAGNEEGKYYYVYDQGDTPAGMDPNNAYDATQGRYFLDKDALLTVKIFLGTPGLASPLPPASSVSIKFVPAGGGCLGWEKIVTPTYGIAQWVDLTGF